MVSGRSEFHLPRFLRFGLISDYTFLALYKIDTKYVDVAAIKLI